MPKWLGVSYAKLYDTFRDELFTFEQAASTVERGDPKLVLSLLRRKGWLTVFGRENRKRFYRLLMPHLAACSLAVESFVIPKQGRYANLVASLLAAVSDRYRGDLQSLVVFGSVARGNAKQDSDMDVLVVAPFRGDAASRIDELVRVEYSAEIGKELAWLRFHKVICHVSWFPLTMREARRFRPFYLDVIEDGLIVYDKDEHLKRVFDVLRGRLERLGAERVWLDRDRWYWKLNPAGARDLVITA